MRFITEQSLSYTPALALRQLNPAFLFDFAHFVLLPRESAMLFDLPMPTSAIPAYNFQALLVTPSTIVASGVCA